jgi:nitroreductase
VVVVTDPTVLEELGPVWRRSWCDYSASTPSDVPPGSPWADYVQRQVPAATELAGRLESIPALAIFCHYPALIGRPDAGLDRPSVTGGASLYPAVQNFLLACRAHGLGAVLTTTLTLAEHDVREVLRLPENVAVHAAVPFGYPDGVSHGPLRRRPVADLLYANRWKEPWFVEGSSEQGGEQ